MAATSDLCARMVESFFFRPQEGEALSPREMAMTGEMQHENAFILIARAAKGDLLAQRTLADLAIWNVLGERDDDPFTMLAEGLVCARQAAAHGDIWDELRVINMLALSTAYAAGDAVYVLAGEAIARCELLADGRDDCAENAAELLTKCAEHEAPESLHWAKLFRAGLMQAKEAS